MILKNKIATMLLVTGVSSLTLVGCSAGDIATDSGIAPGEFVELEGGVALYVENPSTELDISNSELNSALISYPEGLITTETGSYYPWYVPSLSNDPTSLFSWMSDSNVSKFLGGPEVPLNEGAIDEALGYAYQLTSVMFDSPLVSVAATPEEFTAITDELTAEIPLSEGIREAFTSPESDFVLTGIGGAGVDQLPELIENGAPRSVSSQSYYVQLRTVELANSSGDVFDLEFDLEVSYRVSDEVMLAYLNAKGEGEELTDELSDNVGVNFLTYTGSVNTTFQVQENGDVVLEGLSVDSNTSVTAP